MMIKVAGRTGLARHLQRIPGLYGFSRSLLLAVVGRGSAGREIVDGPLKGYRMVLGPHDRNAYLVNNHERAIVDRLCELCRPGMCVLDVGAHVGYFSLLFSVRVGPQGCVNTFEPNPANVTKIREMLKLNQCVNVQLFPVAASDCSEQVRFVTEHTGQMGHIATGPAAASEGCVTVEAVRIDEVARQHEFRRVDLIKLDVEGAEAKALAGMAELLRRDKPVIVCEWHPAGAGDDYEGTFRHFGFRCELLEPASPREPFHVLARPELAK